MINGPLDIGFLIGQPDQVIFIDGNLICEYCQKGIFLSQYEKYDL